MKFEHGTTIRLKPEDRTAAQIVLHELVDRGNYRPRLEMVDTRLGYGGYGWLVRVLSEIVEAPDPDRAACPVCGNPLEPDVEYMQEAFGEMWRESPASGWVFWCDNCGEAGTLGELKLVANSRGKRED